MKNKAGELTSLDYLFIKAKRQSISQNLTDVNYSLQNKFNLLKMIMNYSVDFDVNTDIEMQGLENRDIKDSPYIESLKLNYDLAKAKIKIEKSNLLPDLSFNYFLGTNFYNSSKFYHGFEAGISIPLFFKSQKAKVEASRIASMACKNRTEFETGMLETRQTSLINTRKNLGELINYFNNEGQKLYNEIIRNARVSFENGEIDYFKYSNNIETALQIKLDYLDNLVKYTDVTLELKYLTK